jgi:pimeloyl-ACP methyl ester carboxylesterase
MADDDASFEPTPPEDRTMRSPCFATTAAEMMAPVLVIRGARSDILSGATLNTMRARHPGLESIEVPDQGHVPLLEGAELIRRIAAFVEKCDDAFENV